MNRLQVITISWLLFCCAMAFTQRYWGPYFPDYWRGFVCGGICVKLVMDILWRKREREREGNDGPRSRPRGGGESAGSAEPQH